MRQTTSHGFDVSLFTPGRIVEVAWCDAHHSKAVITKAEVNTRLKHQSAIDNMSADVLCVSDDKFTLDNITFDQIVSVGEVLVLD